MSWRVNVRPCEHCGKELLWGAAPWPVETAPRPPESHQGRAYVFRRRAGRYRAVDVRDLPTPPDEVYPQHVCPVREAMRKRDGERQRRVDAVLRRMAGDA